MKLVLCRKCQDILRLMREPRKCMCGGCGGRYVDDLMARYWGRFAVPIGFDNDSLATAVGKRPNAGQGEKFDAFIIPLECPTFIKVKREA